MEQLYNNYIKLSLLRVYLSKHKFDVICISETYLDSDISHEDANQEIIGYTLIRADHAANTKRGANLLQKFSPLPIVKCSVLGGMQKFLDTVQG